MGVTTNLLESQMPQSFRFLTAGEFNRVKNVWRLALAAGLACASLTASADVIVDFQLQNVTFASGAVATGTFTLDETLQSTTAVDILYSGNPNLPGGFHLTDPTTAGTGCFESSNMLGLGFCNLGNDRAILVLEFVDPLGTGMDAINTKSAMFQDFSSAPSVQDRVTSGSVVPAPVPVPEPETLSLMAGGFVLLAFTRRTLRRATSKART